MLQRWVQVGKSDEEANVPVVPSPVTDAEFDDMVRSCVRNDAMEKVKAKRTAIVKRLQVLTGGKERPDVLGQALRDKNRHWDFLLKEMMWMADDFQQERKRHMSSRRKQAKSVVQHFLGHEARMAKKAKEEQLALRKGASKVAREVRGFWAKLNKVIAYKQRLDADESRKKAMDKHLVFLVKQTERYSSMVVEIPRGDEVDGGKEEEEEDSSSDEDSVSGDGSALEGGIGQGGLGDAPEPSGPSPEDDDDEEDDDEDKARSDDSDASMEDGQDDVNMAIKEDTGEQEATHDGNRKGDTDGDTREAPRIAEQQRALDEDVRAPVKTDTNTNTEDIDQSYEAAATAAGRPGARRDSGSSEGRPNHAGGDDGNKPKASVLSTSEGERAPHDTAGAAGGSPRGRSRSRRRPRISVGSESGGGAIAEAGKRSGWDAWISGERGGRGGPSSDR
ncbi:unnamed protein product, partial [Ascophyllum nodosum]